MTERDERPAGNRPGPELTRREQESLLAALIGARRLEQVLSEPRPEAHGLPGRYRLILTATAAAAGLDGGDRLVAPNGMIAAHLARGADPLEVAAARLGIPPDRDNRQGSRSASVGFRGGIGPDAVVALAVGRAAALARPGGCETDRCVSVALVQRHWTESEEFRHSLALAEELAVPVVIVVIEARKQERPEPGFLPCEDFETVRGGVRSAIADAHAGGGPIVLQCAHQAEGPAARGTLHLRAEDPISAYERRLLAHGFSREQLDAIAQDAIAELDQALAELGVLLEPRTA